MTLHVGLYDSAAGHLKRLMRLLGRRDRVLGLLDDLSFGPIAEGTTFDARARWFPEEFAGYEWYGDIAPRVEAFWAEVASSEDTVIAWFGRGRAVEYCGFLELVTRRRGPLLVVDVTEVAESVAGLLAERIVELALIDRAMPLSPFVIESYRSTWAQLRSENAPLRLVGADGLVSAPIDHFDATMVATAGREWERVLEFLGKCPRHNPLFLMARLQRLVAAGKLEARGILAMETMTTSHVRRA